MTKKEIIKQSITKTIQVPYYKVQNIWHDNQFNTVQTSEVAGYQNQEIIDVDKLVDFLDKKVSKKNLID